MTEPGLHPALNQTSNVRFLQSVHGSSILTFENHKPILLSRGSACLIPESHNVDLTLGRGEHFWLFAEWNPQSRSIPSDDLIATTPFLASHGSPVLRQLSETVAQINGDYEGHPNIILAWINMLIHERVMQKHFSLTPFDVESTEGVSSLLEAIKQNPQEEWNLSRASVLAGYSPFHFSRIFRAITEMGFPQYVDRCRTEIAIKLLQDSTQSITAIAEQCGFGNAQALRTACREYTGFLPSELRSTPD